MTNAFETRAWLKAPAATLLYVCGAAIGLEFSFAPTSVSPVWPAAGVGLAILLRMGMRYWPAILVGAALSSTWVMQSNGVGLLPSVIVGVLLAVGSLIEILAAAWLVRMLLPADLRFTEPAQVLVFCLIVAGSSVIAAAVGTVTLIFASLAPVDQPDLLWLTWWLGDVAGLILVAPLITPPVAVAAWRSAQSLACIIIAGLSVVLGMMMHNSQLMPEGLERLWFLTIPPALALSAWYAGQRGVSWFMLIQAGAGVLYAIRGKGPFASGDQNDSLIMLDSSLILFAVTGLLLAADLLQRSTLNPEQDHRRKVSTPWLTLMVGLTLTLSMWIVVDNSSEREARDRFDTLANDLTDRMGLRLQVFQQIMRGAAGLMTASNEITRSEWARFVEATNVRDWLPGMNGVGFVAWIADGKVEDYEAAVRAQGLTGYKVWPEDAAQHHSAVEFLEPASGRNLLAIGFDMYSEPQRRRAMEQARETGDATMTAKVRLIGETGNDPRTGFVIFMPHYRNGASLRTAQERREALQGWIFSSFEMSSLVSSVLGSQGRQVSLDIYDGMPGDLSARLYASAGDERDVGAQFETTRRLGMLGREWQLVFRSKPEFEHDIDHQKPQIVILAGFALSLLAFLLVRSLSMTRERAENIAMDITRRLRESEAMMSSLIRSAQEAIIVFDERATVVSWNRGAARLFGFAEHEMLGQAMSALLPTRSRQGLSTAESWLHRLRRGSGRSTEIRGLHRSGREVPIEVSFSTWEVDSRPQYAMIVRDVSERERSTAFLRAMFDESPDAILVVDVQGRIMEANPRCRELLGRSPQELTLMQVTDLIPERFVGGHGAHMEAYFRDPRPRSIGGNRELHARHANGQEIPVHIVLTPLNLASGLYVVATIVDISENIEARRALRVSEERFRSTLENAPIGMAIVSLEGRWLEVNNALCQMLGYSREEFMALTFQDITHPEDLDRDLELVQRLLAGQIGDYTMAKRYFRKDQRVVWAQLSVSLLRDEHGQPLHFISQVQDISAQRVADQRLRQTMALQQAMLTSASVGIIAVELDGTVVAFNHAAETMLGYVAGEVIGLSTQVVFHEPRQLAERRSALEQQLGVPLKQAFDVLRLAADRPDPPWDEWLFRRADGSRFPGSLRMTAIKDPASGIQGYLCTVLDLTEVRSKEQALSAALREKETLLKEVYHRVKNNLQIVNSLFNLQARALPDGPARTALREGADRIRAMALVHEKLYQSSSLALISIRDYLNDLCAHLLQASGAAERGIRIESQVQAVDLPLDTAVPLGLLVNELISNSLKHAFQETSDGKIQIVLSKEENGMLEVVIHDNGVGISEQQMEYSNSLGLKLVRTLTRQLSGQFDIENRQGTWTRVRFRPDAGAGVAADSELAKR